MLIALGGAAVVGILALPVLGLIAYIDHSVRETSLDQPLTEGPAQNPDAQTPLRCAGSCFDLDDANLLAVSAEDASVLLIEDLQDDVGALEPSTVAAVAARAGDRWRELGGDAECAFLPANAPFLVDGPDSASEDPVGWVQTWATGDEVMDIAARSFPSTEAATAFLHDLHARVAACPWIDLDAPSAGGADSTLVQIASQAALEVPDEIAAVGWVREGSPGPRWRSYVWDLQRGNLVVQIRVLTDGRIREAQVASFGELVAERLGGLEPMTP